MPRTTWQDLAGDDAPPDRRALADEARREAGAPSSLDDIPQLRDLLAERRRLEQTLERLTGRGAAASPEAERDARRFPMPTREAAPSALDLRRAEAGELRERDAERRAMELETIDERRARRREEVRAMTPEQRAERRRRAGEQRVAAAQRTWERHRDGLITARDTARDLARLSGRLGLPGGDVMERVAQRLDSVTSGLDRLSSALRSDRPRDEGRAADGRDAVQDIGRYRDLARDARRLAEDMLRDTDAGRRLHALREPLDEPVLRRLTGEDDDGNDVSVLEQRRQRALQALRDRREADTPRRRSEPSVD